MNEIEKFVRAYVASAGTDMTLAATYLDEPATFAGPKGFFLMQTKAEVVKFLDGLLTTVRPLGFAKSTCEYLSTKMLNSATALCSVVFVRRKSDDTELQRSGVTYFLRKGDDGWKIRHVMVTDLDKLL